MIQRFIKVTLLTGVPFGLCVSLVFTFLLLGGFSSGLWLGVISGLLFGLGMSVFAEIPHRKIDLYSGIFEGEEIFLQESANYFMNGKLLGGWLALTPTLLVFRNHGVNMRNNPVTIPLSEIREAKPVLIFGAIPLGLEIIRQDGRYELFIVWRRRKWITYITETMDTHGYRSARFSP